MLGRIVMVSSPTRTSLTKSRTIFWRSITPRVSAALRKRARNAVRLSAQAQECSAIVGLVGDRLQLSTECLLALTQHRHALTQLIDRQEFFLIGVRR
jgi:hypothetical protein